MAILKNVEVRWVQVLTPDTRYDHRWTAEAVLSDGQAEELSSASKKFHDKGLAIKVIDGQKTFRFARSVERADGTGQNTAPVCKSTIPDPVTGKPMDFKGLIGNGSICNINYSLYKWDNKFGSGVKADFKGIQVVDLVEYGQADGDEFESDSSEKISSKEESKDDYDDEDFS